MIRRGTLLTVVAGLTALSLPLGWAWADHVRIDVNPQPPASSTTVIVPAPAAPAVPAPPQVLHADQIKAHLVRADTILRQQDPGR